MWKWINFTVRATYILVLIALVAMGLTFESTRCRSTTKACRKCLAHRRIVTRQIMWRVVEDRDRVYPLAGNENIDCQHQWMFIVGSHWSGLGGGYVADGPSDGPSTPELRGPIEEYEQRTGRDYREEVQKVLEVAQKERER